MAEGNIYILINEAMPGYVKVGKTTDEIEKRMKESREKIKSISVNFISLCSQRTIHLVLVRSLVWSRNQTANTPFPHH